MEEEKYRSKPLDIMDIKLQEKFAEDTANQAALMDNMGKQLLTLELGMVGIYATVLKLVAGSEATLHVDGSVVITFFLWLMAVISAVLAIFPEEYKVDSSKMDEIKDYFYTSARKKGKMLTLSVVLFFAGVLVSIFTM
jgi:hypothetical protein